MLTLDYLNLFSSLSSPCIDCSSLQYCVCFLYKKLPRALLSMHCRYMYVRSCASWLALVTSPYASARYRSDRRQGLVGSLRDSGTLRVSFRTMALLLVSALRGVVVHVSVSLRRHAAKCSFYALFKRASGHDCRTTYMPLARAL